MFFNHHFLKFIYKWSICHWCPIILLFYFYLFIFIFILFYLKCIFSYIIFILLFILLVFNNFHYHFHHHFFINNIYYLIFINWKLLFTYLVFIFIFLLNNFIFNIKSWWGKVIEISYSLISFFFIFGLRDFVCNSFIYFTHRSYYFLYQSGVFQLVFFLQSFFQKKLEIWEFSRNFLRIFLYLGFWCWSRKNKSFFTNTYTHFKHIFIFFIHFCLSLLFNYFKILYNFYCFFLFYNFTFFFKIIFIFFWY